jgi:hypothetical protein
MLISLKHRLKDRLPNRAQWAAASGLQRHFRPSTILLPLSFADADLLHKAHPAMKFCLATSHKHPGQMRKTEITGPEGGPVQTEHTLGILPDNDRLHGGKRQAASAPGV